MSSLFGGSESKSYNKAYGQIKGWASPLLQYTGQGARGLDRLLDGKFGQYNTFKNGVGYNWDLKEGTNDLLAQRAAVGGLDSGASLKSLAKYQTGLNNQYLGTYMNGLLGLSGIGTNAAQVLAQAGQVNKSSTSQGIAGGIGSLLSAAAAF